ncbi:MAG: 1-acyl-sn-glycerol-3-phosphate acyltransferase [Desulfobacteraceae bacterium]|nr:MAG: 1-acyl-sn-glycerol-3-phosphate acyltransferase [Desulfobacteraceae bacterium]
MKATAAQPNGNGILAFLHTIIIYVWTIVSTFVFGCTAVLVSFFSKTGNSVHHVARMWGRSILLISGIKVRIIGLEHIDPSRSAIYMSNHQSNFDIPVFFSALPVQFRWLAKAELFRIPIFGQGMRGAGYISIDRSDRKSAMKSLAHAAESIRNGKSVLLFPEGTRSADGTLLPFKSGGFILAVDAGVPIVPMAVQGTFHIMPKHRKLIRRHSVTIVVHPPIDATAYNRNTKNDLLAHVRSSILEAMSAESDGGERA